MDMDTSKMLSIPNENHNLPPQLKEARKMMRYASIFFLVAAVLYGLWGLWSIMQGLFWSATLYGGTWGAGLVVRGVIYLVFGVIALVLKTKFEEEMLYPLDRGQTKHVKDNGVLYIILGFIFGMALAGIFAVLGYMKLDEVDTTSKNCPTCGSQLRYIEQYNQWYCDSCQDYKMPVEPAQHPQQQQPPEQGYQTQQQQQGSQQQPQQTEQRGWQQSEQQTQQQPQQQQGWGQTPPTSQQQQPKQQQSQQQQNNCPTCGGQLRYIQEYNRWYCDSCQEYK